MVLEQKPARKQGAPNRCCHRTIPTASASSLTTTAWSAGLLLSAIAQHLGLRELVDHHLDLGDGRTRGTRCWLVASALAGGDCIDDADALRAGGTVSVLGCMVKAPSTLGTFLRLSLGACPSTRPREPPVAGPGMGRWGRNSPLSTWTRPSARPMDWPRRERATTATPAREGITRCWPLPPAPARC